MTLLQNISNKQETQKLIAKLEIELRILKSTPLQSQYMIPYIEKSLKHLEKRLSNEQIKKYHQILKKYKR